MLTGWSLHSRHTICSHKGNVTCAQQILLPYSRLSFITVSHPLFLSPALSISLSASRSLSFSLHLSPYLSLPLVLSLSLSLSTSFLSLSAFLFSLSLSYSLSPLSLSLTLSYSLSLYLLLSNQVTGFSLPANKALLERLAEELYSLCLLLICFCCLSASKRKKRRRLLDRGMSSVVLAGRGRHCLIVRAESNSI